MSRFAKGIRRWDRAASTGTVSTTRIGVVFIAVVLIAGVLLFNKDKIGIELSSGDTMKVHFARDYRLQPYQSKAKIGFVPVGDVTDVEKQDDGTSMVTIKIAQDDARKLRSQPRAVIRPTTLLGGNYFIDLQADGPPGIPDRGVIPMERTQLPVELDKVAGALQPDALAGMRSSIGSLDQTLERDGRDAIDKLVADAPATLDPAADVLAAVRGEHPSRDLTNLISGLRSTSARLSEHQGQLSGSMSNLHASTEVLSTEAEPLARAVNQLPATLESTDDGLRRLDTSLGKLRDTADDARPTAEELAGSLEHANPVLARARPFVQRTDALLDDAKPVVQQLVPTARSATSVLNDVKGPVLDRVNGPVRNFLNSPYKGVNEYARSESNVPMFQDVTGAVANLDKASSLMDKNGNAIAIQVGFGLGSVGNLPVNPQTFFDQLTRTIQRNQQEGR